MLRTVFKQEDTGTSQTKQQEDRDPLSGEKRFRLRSRVF